jgi:hypothetical protein
MTTKPVNFIKLTLTNNKEVRIKRTAILTLEETRNGTLVYFQGGQVRVFEGISEIERMIFN